MAQHFITTIFFLSTALTSFGQRINLSHKIVYTVDFNYLEGCETGKGACKPVIITRHSIRDSIRMIFPVSGTQSAVYLYESDCDSAYVKYLNKTPGAQREPLLQDQKSAGQGKPSLDLTELSDGRYGLHMLSCGLGGSFELIILTVAEKPPGN